MELFTAAVLPTVVPKPHPLQPLPSLLPPPHLPPPIIPSSVRDSKQEDRISQLVMKAAILEKELEVRNNFEDASSKKEDRLFDMFFKMVDKGVDIASKGAELSTKNTTSVTSSIASILFLLLHKQGHRHHLLLLPPVFQQPCPHPRLNRKVF